MTNLSRVISLPVYSIYESEYKGVVENALIHPTTRKIEWLVIYNEETDTKSVLKFEKIYKISDFAVLIRNSSQIQLYESVELELSNLYNPINSQVITCDGKDLGRVIDVEISKNRVEKLVLENSTIPHNKILSFSDKITFIKTSSNQTQSRFQNKKVNIVKIERTELEQKVNILEKKEEPLSTPKKAVVNYNFLINRIITKDIASSTGEVIAKKDTKINLSIIDNIRQHGKLKELTLFSK